MKLIFNSDKKTTDFQRYDTEEAGGESRHSFAR